MGRNPWFENWMANIKHKKKAFPSNANRPLANRYMGYMQTSLKRSGDGTQVNKQGRWVWAKGDRQTDTTENITFSQTV